MQIAQEWHATSERNDLASEEVGLLCAAQAGDIACLERLLARHEGALVRLCRAMLAHAEDAEDAVQETFLRALAGLNRFRGEAGFRTWLFRIAVNLCLDWKSARRPVEPLSEKRIGALTTASPEADVIRQMSAKEALRTLQPRQRALIVLKEVEGWSVAEIAAALRCSEKKVHNDLYQARRALAEWRRNAQEEESQ